jgi:hypothetical protein
VLDEIDEKEMRWFELSSKLEEWNSLQSQFSVTVVSYEINSKLQQQNSKKQKIKK